MEPLQALLCGMAVAIAFARGNDADLRLDGFEPESFELYWLP